MIYSNERGSVIDSRSTIEIEYINLLEGGNRYFYEHYWKVKDGKVPKLDLIDLEFLKAVDQALKENKILFKLNRIR